LSFVAHNADRRSLSSHGGRLVRWNQPRTLWLKRAIA
jgi:hypothetical protein